MEIVEIKNLSHIYGEGSVFEKKALDNVSLAIKEGEFIEMFVKSYKEEVPFVKEDRILHYDIEKSVAFLRSFHIDNE